jgi:hypothetical protein
MLPGVQARIAAMDMREPSAPSSAPLWLKILAAAVMLPGFWVSILFAVLILMPTVNFPQFQLLMQIASLPPAGVLAWLAVRRAPAYLLAVLIPVLLALYFATLGLVAMLPALT